MHLYMVFIQSRFCIMMTLLSCFMNVFLVGRLSRHLLLSRLVDLTHKIRLILTWCGYWWRPQVSDLALVLISGRSGALIGRPVNFNLTTQGKLIGPLLHETLTGAYYVLFGLGESRSPRLIMCRAVAWIREEKISRKKFKFL